MEIRGRTCVGARGVVVADRDGEGAGAVASEIGEGAIEQERFLILPHPV